MMERIVIILLVILSIGACNDVKVGYLQTKDASYAPKDSLVIRKVLGDDKYDDNRLANNAPWVTGNISGVLGTEPLFYELVGVKALNGTEEEAALLAKEITVRGCGKMEVPLKPEAPAGRYVVTLRVSNEGYSAILSDIFTFIIE